MQSETLTLADGYSRRRTLPTATYRRMTVAEAKALRPGSRVPFLSADGTARELTINGAPKTWKTRPGDVRVPVKYGLYEYGHAEAYGGSESDPVDLLLVRVDAPEEANRSTP